MAAFSAAPLFGQTLGEITGRVADSSGASVPGAVLTLTNTSTNAVRTTDSTGTGDYTFPSVPPGFYNLKAEHAGFKSATTNGLEVQVQQTVRLDMTLQVGQVSESVEVSAQADLLQAENASVGTVIENKGVTELPLNGRSYLGLVALAANANTLSPTSGQAGSREGGDRASQSISAAGQRIFFDYFTLDGVNNTDPNFLSYVVLPSIDAIQEFKVQTGIYPAEFGHEATQINVLTKSGGNDYHGALFDFIRNDVFDAVPYAFTSNHPNKSPFKWNDWGFELDGPVRIPKLFNGKNKLFFMINDEWKQQRQNSQGVFSVPTAAMFAGNETGLNTIYDPTSANASGARTPFPNNTIPTSRLDPISQKLLAYYPSAILPGLSNNYVQPTSAPANRDGLTLRMDWVESAKSQWTGRYSWGDENQSNTGLSITGSKILTNYEQYLGSNTRTITPTLVNEARYGYSRFYNSIGTLSAFTFDSVTPLGIPGLQAGAPVTWGVPSMAFNGDGFTGIGDSSDGPYQNDNNTLQVVDNLSWIKGKHTFRFGFEYNRQNYNQVGNQFSRGQWTFQPNVTQSAISGTKTGGDAFAEFLLGQSYNAAVAVSIANAKFQRNVEAAFADDTWKITPKLTLSLGLRYELTPPWTDTLNNDFTFAIPQIVNAASNQPTTNQPFFVREGNCTDPYAGLNIRWTGTPAVCGGSKYPVQLMKTSYGDFAPRFGVSWSPDTKTVVRTGVGIFYSQDIGNAVFDMSRNIAAKVITTPAAAGLGVPWNQSVPAGQSGGGAAVVNVPPTITAYVDAYDHHTSYAMQYLLNIQRQFAGNWLVEAGYLGGVSRHLQGFQDPNQATPGTTGTWQSRAPWTDVGIIQLVNDGANASYNSFSVKATRRYSAGVSVIGSYTFSKSLDDTSGIRVQGYDQLFPQNSYCIACEKGLSSFDARHRVVTSVLYDLPVGKGKMLNIDNPVLNTVVGGWQSGGILTLQTGLPGTLNIGGVDNSSTGEGGYDHPNSTGVSPYLNSPTPSRYFNLAAFVEAPSGQFGNVGRNTITGPGIFNMDFEIHKSFKMPFKENHNLQFRLEAFNVLNHPNWTMPNLNILAGSAQPGMPATAAHQGFGVSTGTLAMRQVQLALKYTF